MRIQIKMLLILLVSTLLLFQNCGESVDFNAKSNTSAAGEGNALNEPGTNSGGDGIPTITPVDDSAELTPPTVVCNPLDPTASCATGTDGLIGKLYYLTYNQHAPLFNGNLRNANLQDYRDSGIEVPVDIVMSNFDIPTRDWTTGFALPNNEFVKKENGELLNEWFHLDMMGYISLPVGNYQIATLSDDGIRVTIDGQVVINNDTVHPPTLDCSQQIISFSDGEKKFIRVEYHQGPRTQIALQLFSRAYSGSQNCSGFNDSMVISPEAFSQVDNIADTN